MALPRIRKKVKIVIPSVTIAMILVLLMSHVWPGEKEANHRARIFKNWDQFEIIPDMSLPQDSQKFVIYRCAEEMLKCGGWGGRLKGMILGYLIAYLTDRDFKIEVLTPRCDITQVIVPNRYNWSLPESFHKVVDPESPPNCSVFLKYHNRNHNYFDQIDFHKIFDQDIPYVYVETNWDYLDVFKKNNVYRYKEKLARMKNQRKDKIYSELYRRLFRPSPKLETRLQLFFSQTVPTPRHKLICAHIRMGRDSSLGLSLEPVRFRKELLPVVWDFLSAHSVSDLHKVFVMSDSEDVVQMARSQSFGHRVISDEGPIRHIDKKQIISEDICDAQEKVIFEQHVLMACDVLLVSVSSLSRMSAYVRNSDEGLYCLFTNGKIISCNGGQMTALYNLRD